MINQFSEIVFLIVILLTNAIQAITGFAGTLLAMPPSIKLIGVDEAKVMLNIITWLSCFYISIKNYKYLNKKELLKIIVFMAIGMVVGIRLFKILPLEILLRLYGVMIILIALKNLLVEKKIGIPNIFMTGILLVSGIIHGMFVSGGALLVVYVAGKIEDKNEFRATIAPVWVILNTLMGYNQVIEGQITKKLLILLALSIPPMIIGIMLGSKLYHKINQELFKKITYVLLGLSGVLVIF